jgi:hypothetical protein
MGFWKWLGNKTKADKEYKPLMSPTRSTPTVRRRVRNFMNSILVHTCDACGRSDIDNKPLTEAKYEIQLKDGSRIYLCSHHLRKHETRLILDGHKIVPFLDVQN